MLSSIFLLFLSQWLEWLLDCDDESSWLDWQENDPFIFSTTLLSEFAMIVVDDGCNVTFKT